MKIKIEKSKTTGNVKLEIAFSPAVSPKSITINPEEIDRIIDGLELLKKSKTVSLEFEYDAK